MAALILGCGALVSDKLSKRRKEKKEAKLDYEKNFEVLKEENMKRVEHIRKLSVESQDLPSSPPPNYDAVAASRQRTAPMPRRTAHVFGGVGTAPGAPGMT